MPGAILVWEEKGSAMRLFKDELRDLRLFADTTRAERERIRRRLTVLRVPAGRVLVHEGGLGDQFMIIAEGSATVSRDGRTIATLERGDLVGEMALLDDERAGRRNATVTTSTDALLYVGTPAEFREILDAAPSVARKVQQTALERTALRAA
jgi:CRP/FNR family transcriptional regulator, cyclic AMP receptor protein